MKFLSIVNIRGFDVEPGNEYYGITYPKEAVGAKCNGGKRISADKFPHPCDELTKAATSESCPISGPSNFINVQIPSPMATFGIVTCPAWILIRLRTEVVTVKQNTPKGLASA